MLKCNIKILNPSKIEYYSMIIMCNRLATYYRMCYKKFITHKILTTSLLWFNPRRKQ